jgi:RNA polymerase-binding transcription factor DksA
VFVLHITSSPVIPVIRREKMLKKQLTLLFALVLTFPLAAVVLGQKAPAKSKEARWEGRVERTSKEQSSLTVRQTSSSAEKACVFDSATKWVSQYHHDKKVNDIDASQVKEGDYVICKGTEEKGGEIHATVISKRLSHSPDK